MRYCRFLRGDFTFSMAAWSANVGSGDHDRAQFRNRRVDGPTADCDLPHDPNRPRDRVDDEHERNRNLIRKREPAQDPRRQQGFLADCDRVYAVVADDQRGSQPEGSESCMRGKQ
jgi:hypothetical protein